MWFLLYSIIKPNLPRPRVWCEKFFPQKGILKHAFLHTCVCVTRHVIFTLQTNTCSFFENYYGIKGRSRLYSFFFSFRLPKAKKTNTSNNHTTLFYRSC